MRYLLLRIFTTILTRYHYIYYSHADWMMQVYFPSIFRDWVSNATTDATTAPFSYEPDVIKRLYVQTHFIGDPVVRMTLRKYQVEHKTNLVWWTSYISRSYFAHDSFLWERQLTIFRGIVQGKTSKTQPTPHIPMLSQVKILNLSKMFNSLQELSVTYTNPGTILSPASAGGFVFNFTRNTSASQELFYQIYQAQLFHIDVKDKISLKWK